jgi:hypothetical protein
MPATTGIAPLTSSTAISIRRLNSSGRVGVAFAAAAADADAVHLLLQHEADDAAEGLLVDVAVGVEGVTMGGMMPVRSVSCGFRVWGVGKRETAAGCMNRNILLTCQQIHNGFP